VGQNHPGSPVIAEQRRKEITGNAPDPDLLASVASLELRARLVIEGILIGMHRSPHQGTSIEFAQHRAYAPGDDLRHLDWKVFARTDKLQLKQYRQETSLELVLLVDVSGSMGYSSSDREATRKFDLAATLAAVLAYLALHQQDQVGLITFGNGVSGQLRLASGRAQWRTIIELLTAGAPLPAEGDDDGRGTDLAPAVDQVIASLRKRSLIVLISDLFDEIETIERSLARVHHRGHDLILMQTLDPAERGFPFSGPAALLGMEGEGRLNINASALRRSYLEGFQAHRSRLLSLAQRFRFDYVELDRGQALGPRLSRLLARRRGSGHRSQR